MVLSSAAASVTGFAVWKWHGRGQPRESGPALSSANTAPPSVALSDMREATLAAWVDTLMPAEPDFAGAVALGVVPALRTALQRSQPYNQLAREAQAWLDGRARERGADGFAVLDESGRQAVVQAAADSAPGTAARTFFDASWDDIVFHAYADPRAWADLGYAGPPQPVGFLDHAHAPRKA